MTTAAQTQSFFTLLAAEKQLVEKFVGLLKAEQEVLTAGRKDEIAPLTASKTTLAETLSQQSEKRQVLMAESGIPTDREGLKQWMTQQAAEHQELWASFIGLASEAKLLNDINGRLVAERLSNNQQAIQTLMAAANRPATYGPDGQTNSIGHGRTIGSA